MDWKKYVYKVVKMIPKGKVSNYGTISEYISGNWKLETGKSSITARMVGWALHHNPDPETIPCHRVVDRNGKLAKNYAFGGWRRQKEKLLEEGVGFKDKTHVDFPKDGV